MLIWLTGMFLIGKKNPLIKGFYLNTLQVTCAVFWTADTNYTHDLCNVHVGMSELLMLLLLILSESM